MPGVAEGGLGTYLGSRVLVVGQRGRRLLSRLGLSWCCSSR